MDSDLAEKYRRLLDYLGSLERVAVACSGGVDSTFLVFAAVAALGPERVHVLFGDSCLLSERKKQQAREILLRELPEAVRYDVIALDPLSDQALAANDEQRCYLCKKRIYSTFIKHLKQTTGSVTTHLVDGTNVDDLTEDRPGLNAVRELGILTPLVVAGFRKTEIRSAAASLNLSNAYLPSDSCLATRIEHNQRITETLLQQVERFEEFLMSRGFTGCRVRPRGDAVIIAVQESDLAKIVELSENRIIKQFFREMGYHHLLLDLNGRKL